MRVIIYGAGAVGGTIGAMLHRAGHEVALIARGAHLEAIRAHGLRLRTPVFDEVVHVTAYGSPAEITFRPNDIVLLTMKTQDTVAALDDLRAVAGTTIPVVCAQNGVENERLAARRFDHVYGMLVQLPASHIEPGEVLAEGGPRLGVLDVGRYPTGLDDTVEELSAMLRDSSFVADPSDAVMRLKYAKLTRNLGNVMALVTGTRGGRQLMTDIQREAEAVYRAAGIDCASVDEYQSRVDLCAIVEVPGIPRAGNSTMQSVLRGRTSVETDYLNGEIAHRGAEYGVPTPVNRTMQDLAAEVALGVRAPASMTADEVLAMAEARANRPTGAA